MGAGCFCAFGTVQGLPRPWTYRWVGSGFTGVFAFANATIKCVLSDFGKIGNKNPSCVFGFTEIFDPPRERGVEVSSGIIFPTPVLPDTCWFKVQVRVDRDPPTLGQDFAQSIPVFFELPDPTIEPSDPFTVDVSDPPGQNGTVTMTPRRWDWEIGEPI